MIAKIVKGSGFGGTVRYIIDDKKQANIICSESLLTNSVESIIMGFEAQKSLRPEITQPVYHISLGFSPEDREKLSDELMAKIAREYMELMGITNTQYIAVRHHDKRHPHVHLCINRIDNDGKLISDRNSHTRNNRVCKALTQKYGLHFSVGTGENYDRLREPIRSKVYIKNAMRNVLPYANNWAELAAHLRTHQIDIEFKRKGSTDQVEGVKFSYNGKSFSGSKIDPNYSFSRLNNLFLSRQEAEREVQEQPTTLVSLYSKPTHAEPKGDIVDTLVQLLNTSESENVGGSVNNELNKKRKRL